jgi:hypothetical protein
MVAGGPSGAEPPETDDELIVEAPKKRAAGLASVRSAFAHMQRSPTCTSTGTRSRPRSASSDR